MAQDTESFKAFVIIVLILAAIAGAALYIPTLYHPTSPNKLVYNNFEFEKKNDGFWYTQLQRNGTRYDVGLRYSPKEAETVPIRGRLNETFLQQPYYVTFDPDAEAAEFKYLALGVAEFGLNIVRGMGREFVTACTKNLTEACAAHPIVTCDNDDIPVVYFKTANETRVRLDGNCLTIEGTEMELLRATDRVLYHFYKIMP